MRMIAQNIRSRISAFARAERGVLTVEGVIWLPIYFIFLSLIVDVTVLFHHKAQAIRIVQDANRGMNIGLFDDAEAAKTEIEKALDFSENAKVETFYFGTDNEFIGTRVSMPATDLAVIGFFAATLNNITVEVTAYHLAKNCLVDPIKLTCKTSGAGPQEDTSGTGAGT